MARQSSNALSRLASRILKGAEATRNDIMQLAASVLSQDETRGERATARKAKTRKSAPATGKRAAKKRSAKKRK